MRLVELDPHWITFQNAAEGVVFYFGVSFLCPHCEHGPCPTCGHMRGRRIAASFWPPIDPDKWENRIAPIPHDKFHKRVSGETFDTLTLQPSIRIEGHWHGTITNGEVAP